MLWKWAFLFPELWLHEGTLKLEWRYWFIGHPILRFPWMQVCAFNGWKLSRNAIGPNPRSGAATHDDILRFRHLSCQTTSLYQKVGEESYDLLPSSKATANVEHTRIFYKDTMAHQRKKERNRSQDLEQVRKISLTKFHAWSSFSHVHFPSR